MSVKLDLGDFKKSAHNYINDLKNQFETNININVNLIKDNLDVFNTAFGTSFTKNSSNDEFIIFFNNEYKNLFFKCVNTNIDFRTQFNLKFTPYANVDIQY